ncbi:hypothetical protein ACFQL0_21630 [Haloplanus litoreus]|uniref:hypothetical protein n=1 Tax=Haloplanus litoreus TaxID=767515 RepID=UPI003614F157
MALTVGPQPRVDQFDELEDEIRLPTDECVFGLVEHRLPEFRLETRFERRHHRSTS